MNALSIKGLAIGLTIGLIAGLLTGYIFVMALTLRVVQLEAEIEEKDTKISDLSTQLGDKSGEVADLQKRVEELQAQLGDKSGEVTDLQKRIEELEAKIEESEKPEDVSPTPPSPPISSKYPAKTVTWADGTSETIQVTEKGRIFLNGREVKAFGYCIAYGGGLMRTFGSPTDALAERTFGWLHSKGVRFITLTAGDPGGYTEFWMRYCYKHKMFVHYVTAQDPGYNIDVNIQFERFKRAVDIVDGLPQEHANSIYAVNMPSWELNIYHRDPAMLDDYHSRIKPLCRDYLLTSKIGDVPLTAKCTHGIFYEHAYPIVKHSDIPCWDAYPRLPNPIDDFDWCMNKIRNEVLPATGKTGYQIWLTEHGVFRAGIESGNVDPGYPPELLDHILAQPGISSVAIWALHYWDGDECNDFGAFWQRTGEPKQWTIDLAPHFPKCETLPVADAGLDQTVAEDTLVTFDGSGSSDNTGITSCTWTFMDVTPQTLTGINPTYTFSTPGSYTVTLRVTDAAGNYAMDTVTITVLDVTKPVADVGDTIDIGTIVAFNAGGSSDNVAITSYDWDFGDGTTGTGITTNHTYTEPGTYTVTLTVRDATDNSDTDSVVVTVSVPFPWWVVGVMVATVIAFVVLVLQRHERGKN